jgi:hypothetical protein
MDEVYPSALQLSLNFPPFPEAHTKIEPFPSRPRSTPSRSALEAKGPGPSTVSPLSAGPQEAE